jgi:hypothetical protein
MAKKKKEDAPGVRAIFTPGFAQVAVALLDKAVKGQPLDEPEREGLVIVKDTINKAFIAYLRGE